MQDLSTYLLISSGFLLETIVTNDKVNSSLFARASKACCSSKLFSDKKSCNFLLWLNIVFIIYLTSYSLLALEVVVTEWTVSDCLYDDAGLLPIDDLGLTGNFVVVFSSCYPSWFDFNLIKGFELYFCCKILFLLEFSFRVLAAYSFTLDTDDACFIKSCYLSN